MEKSINIEIADTPELLSQGLMFRKSLENNKGMLFKFPDIVYASFWGKNTYIPLDVAFITKDGTILDIREIVPMSTKLVHSAIPCKYAIEVNSGFFRDNNIAVGSKVVIDEQNGQASFSIVKNA